MRSEIVCDDCTGGGGHARRYLRRFNRQRAASAKAAFDLLGKVGGELRFFSGARIGRRLSQARLELSIGRLHIALGGANGSNGSGLSGLRLCLLLCFLIAVILAAVRAHKMRCGHYQEREEEAGDCRKQHEKRATIIARLRDCPMLRLMFDCRFPYSHCQCACALP